MEHIVSKFEQMGARIRINELPPLPENWNNSNRTPNPFTIGIENDKHGQYYQINFRTEIPTTFSVQEVDKKSRHLLLIAKAKALKPHSPDDIFKVLCGHDEREWFISRLDRGVNSIRAAFEALKPNEVLGNQRKVKLKTKLLRRRRNKAYKRQGEFFFIEAPNLQTDENFLLKDERIFLQGQRAGRKAHIAQFAYRTGGTILHICDKYQSGVTTSRYHQILKEYPDAKLWGWSQQTLNPELYVRGYIRHKDHKTVYLHDWHRVYVNHEIRDNINGFLD